MANELHKREEQRRRRRWLAAGFIGLGLIAVGCRHHGVQELTTGEGTSAETGGEGSETGVGEHAGEGSEDGGGEGSETGGGERSEGGGEHGGEGSEGGGEHGGEGSEGGEEERPTTPLDQIVSGNLNSLDYTAAYDPASNEFRGVVENNTSQTVCAARVEVHVATNGRVVELGPTAGVDLAAGETLAVVLLSDSISPETYSFHAESSPCP